MISVCIATYNGEKYIKKQLLSILNQLGDYDEIIVSDDNSTDNTIKIIKEINDRRIKIYFNNGKHGFVKNFENALVNAKGDYIFLSDQDDEWMDNKVEKTIYALRDSDFVVSDCITIDSNDKIIDYSRFKTFNIKKGFWRLMIKTRYLGCCMAFNKKVLKAVIPFPKRDDLVEHDLWIAAVSEKYFKVKLINEPLILYKRHNNNTSDAGFGKGNNIIIKIYRRIYRYLQIIKIKDKIILINKEE